MWCTDEDDIHFEPPHSFESFANHSISGGRFGVLSREFREHRTLTSLLNGTNVRCPGISSTPARWRSFITLKLAVNR